MPDGFEPNVSGPAPDLYDYVIHGDAGKLFADLAKAQGKIKNATKDAANPHFKSKYADLAAISDACRDALSAHGIAVVQVPHNDGENIAVTTILGHSSGARISGKLKVRPTKWDAQGVGSVVTYLRRYALAAMAGVAPANEDDDGEAAVGRDSGRPHNAEMHAPATNGNRPRTVTPNQSGLSPNRAMAKEKYDAIKARITKATRDDQVDLTLEDGRDDVAFIKQHASDDHVQALYDLAAKRKAQIAGIGEPTPVGAHP